MINTSRTHSDKSNIVAQNTVMVGNSHYIGSFAVSAAQKSIVSYPPWFYEHGFWLKLPYE